jgi:hypothetical protein
VVGSCVFPVMVTKESLKRATPLHFFKNLYW